MPDDELDLTPFRGDVAPAFRDAAALAHLRDLPARLAPPAAAQAGRAAPVRDTGLPHAGGTLAVAVKAFPRQGLVRSLLARLHGSMARQSFAMARAFEERGVPTPRPVAFLERWRGGRLQESYLLTERVDAAATLHTELLHLLHHEPDQDKVLNLLGTVCGAVRAMHEAGLRHGDLGNQNILVRRLGPERWGEVSFVDLDRGRVRAGPCSLRDRAFDLSRLRLPSKLRTIFQKVYFGTRRPPRGFARWERCYRWRFALHEFTRPLRHPLRARRRRRLRGDRPRYPRGRELWLWDRRTDQAIATLERGERTRRRLLAPATPLKILLAVPRLLLPALLDLRGLRCYGQPVEMRGRLGMTLHPAPETAEAEVRLLQGLGRLPVLVRYYAHEDEAHWDFTSALLRRLHDERHEVSVALVQDRRAVADPARWERFVRHVMDGVGAIASWVEIGHATNRVKWGVWTLAEYHRLLRPFAEVRRRHPSLRLMGPATNDFEMHHTAAALAWLPRDFRLDGLSCHLYVDRRGRPENAQRVLGRDFTAVDKFALARAVARRARRCADHVIVSEVNWFLKDEAGYAHPLAPYTPGAPKAHEWDVDEDTYADYMLRYYLHALCSGMVDLVFWWRLVSPAFGLVDGEGRPRPAYRVLQAFLREFGESTFTARVPGAPDTWLLRFRRREDEAVVAFTSGAPRRVALPFAFARATDSTGAELAFDGTCTGRPVYLLGARFQD